MVKIDEVRLMLFSAIEIVGKENLFKQRKYPQGGGMLRITPEITDTIGWGILDYGELKKFGGFVANTCHNEIREITLPFFIKHGFMGKSAKIKDWVPSFHPPQGIPIKNLNDLGFRNIEEIEFLKEVYVDFFVNEAIPHYKKWSSLLSVYDYVKNINEDKDAGLGQFPQYEKAVIMRLCNDSRYKEYFYNYVLEKEYYYKTAPNEDTLAHLNAANEMAGILDKIQPKYNLLT